MIVLLDIERGYSRERHMWFPTAEADIEYLKQRGLILVRGTGLILSAKGTDMCRLLLKVGGLD